MTIEELAAQRCADNWNELKVNGCTSWEASDFLGYIPVAQLLYRRLTERIHHAIKDFEAGDKGALDEFRLVEPVDPLVEAIRSAILTDAVKEDANRLRNRLAKHGLEIVEIGKPDHG